MNTPGAGDCSLASTLDIKTQFASREGCYRNLSSHEYSRINRLQSSIVSGNQQPNVAVRISMVQVSDDETGYPDRLLVNVGRELLFYVFRSIWEIPDLARPLHREVHKVFPTCHDINPRTCSAHGCTMVVGFASGAFQVSDPKKEPQLCNEDKLLDKTRVTCVKWFPGSSQQYLVAFASGQLFHCDDSLPWLQTAPNYQLYKHGEGYAVYTCKSRTTRNPLYRWMIGEGSLNAFAFSPCSKYIATASHDGVLRVFVIESMDLVSYARSYFGALLCLCWSPDSKFICSAGEDDLVHLFSLDSRKVVARGRGHRSWITAVAFDPVTSCLSQDTTESTRHPSTPSGKEYLNQRITTYRFASVGQDTQICLWELTDDIVKQASTTRLRQGSLLTSPVLNLAQLSAGSPNPKKTDFGNLKKNLPLLGKADKSSSNARQTAVVGSPPLKDDLPRVPSSSSSSRLDEVPFLAPLVCKRIASERLNDIFFHEDCILISTQEGAVQIWSRPGKGGGPNNVVDRKSS